MATEILNSTFIRLIFELIIIYSVGLGLAILARKIKQPVFIVYIVGGIILGVIIGPRTNFKFLIDLMGGFTVDSREGALSQLSQIGLIFLLFLTGLETHSDELKRYGKHSVLTSMVGVITPFILVFFTTLFIGFDYKVAIVTGAAVVATSIGVSKQKFRSIGQEECDAACIVKGASIVDDIIGVIVISVLMILIPNNILDQTGWKTGLIDVFITFLSILIIGFIIVKLDKKIKSRNFRVTHYYEIIMGTIIFIFVLSFFANFLGVSAVIGSYFAGLILSLTRLKETVIKFIEPITEIFIAPVYFISKGLALDILDLNSIIVIGVIIAIMTILGKTLGAGLGAKLTGLDNKSALRVGFAMVPIGEVAYLLASIARDAGILGYEELGSIVFVILITSIAGPILLNSTYKTKCK
ncbi:MAG: sodium/hydrogen exchanger [Fusobacteria bacterium]|nr:MAG: sodium/hydrogen exchanger [Fusobacteriota bacterium]KAF0230134.1 MAG: sodium/hydrogen [Fusobacteriota bacterium]